MSTPVKVVQLTAEERDILRKLKDSAQNSERDLNNYSASLRNKYKPAERQYAPFYETTMTVVDNKGDDATITDRGDTHLLFYQRMA